MRRSPSSRGFTMIEMIIVIGIIAILTCLVLALVGLVKIRGTRAKADGDRNALAAACEAYKTDNGGYPQDNPPSSNGASVSNDLDPRIHFDPSSTAAPSYAASSLFLYKQLTGDTNADGVIDATETGRKYAAEFFTPARFDANYRTSGIISYITDPSGYSFGYSTAGLKAEQDYRVTLEGNPKTPRPSPTKGYNPTFDLWSTAGSTKTTNEDQAKWVKNW